jgi:hypothetical protein
MTFSSKPTQRVWRLPTILGSKVPLRSRGERIRTGPWSRLAGRVAEVLGQLGLQRALQQPSGELPE